MKCSAMVLTLALVDPAVAGADTPPPDICGQIVAQVRAQKTPVHPWQWPGVETERTISTIGDGAPFQAVLQADKARLLNEAAVNDPSRIDLWRILLASNPVERADAESHLLDRREFDGMLVRELPSLHLGYLSLSIGGDLGCSRISDYYTGQDGKVHIPPQAAPAPGEDGADRCEANGHSAYYRWRGRVLSVNDSSRDDRTIAYAVSLRNSETGWTPQCRIDADYGFVYSAKPFDAYGARTSAVVLMANPHNVFMVAQVDGWGHVYRPYYDTSKPEERQAIQNRLFAGHPGSDFNAFQAAIKAAGAYTQDSDLYIPVNYQGATVLVKVAQGWLRQEPQPNVEFEMYEMKDGRAILVGAVDTELVPGALQKLTLAPL